MQTEYRNTDLDLVSEAPFEPLGRYLESAGMIEIAKFQDGDGNWHASYEVIAEEDPAMYDRAENTIAAMLDILEVLPANEKTLLENCQLREFNVAYDVGEGPYGFNEPISAVTLSRMSRLKSSLRVTLYPEAGMPSDSV